MKMSMKIDLDDIENKLNSGAFTLVEKLNAKSKVWKIFREVRVTTTHESVGVVLCTICHSIYTYSASKTGSSHLNRHPCNLIANLDEENDEEQKKKITLDTQSKTNKRKSAILDAEKIEKYDFSSPLRKKDKSECTEFDAIGIIVAAKLQKMSTAQQIYAEFLINSVLTRGLLDTLSVCTELTQDTPLVKEDETDPIS